MLFLTQPSQFILAWDRHQICWLACPVAKGHKMVVVVVAVVVVVVVVVINVFTYLLE